MSFAAVLALAQALGAAPASTPPSTPAPVATAPAPTAAPARPGEVAEVVVTATRPQTIAEFVAKFAAPTGPEGRLARWNGTICPGVVGLNQKYAEYLNDKLAATAQAVGLKVGEPGCSPDILIVVTADPDRLLQVLSKSYRRRLGVQPDGDELVAGGSGRESFDDFVKIARPVRWWHVSERVAADGSPMDGKTVNVFSPSRLRSALRDDLHHVIIVVDAKAAVGVSYEALASYVSMVSLAQLSPDAGGSPKLPTILSLFRDKEAGRTPPGDLTNWDLAYLKGLYGARMDAPDLQTQNNDIAKSMQKAAGKPAGH